VVWIAEFVALIGFSMVIPFLPLYVQEMGVTDEAQVKFWSGMLLSGQAITMAIFGPIWGSVADRYGRKLMLQRATFGATLVLTLMSFAQTPLQLLLLRVLQGSLTGTVPAATALIASVVPRERTGSALGLLQMGMYAGVSIGPLVGGVVADTLGYRYSFLLTGACLFLAGLGVFFFVHEDFQRPDPNMDKGRRRWWDGLVEVVRSRHTLVPLVIRFLTRTGVRIVGPVLPLFVAALMPPSSSIGVATMTGIVTAANSVASSGGAALLGRTSDRVGYRRVLLLSALAAGLFYFVQASVANATQLTILQFCLGGAIAGTISTLAALLARLVPQGQEGTIYGLDTTVVSGANAVGPMLGAAVAVAWGNRAAFLLAGGFFVLAAGVVAWLVPQSSSTASTSSPP
jgi:DHA1 family multidrug resistance protein-like MFS transporter